MGCPSESSIEIKFSDTGKGIAPSDVPKVFDPYFYSKGLGTQKGRGLGLSVVKALVENHGGSIAIKSRLNKGTQVIINLPSCAMKRRLVREQFDSLHPEKPIVLIMDDEPSVRVRTLSQRLLERLGYAVIATGNSMGAQFSYEYACQHHVQIDLVLFDQNIKNSSGGIETLNRLHQSGFNGKSVIVTGSPSSPVISDYKFYGFDARVLKPFSIKEFEKVIASVMTE
ncbi:MAG: ATP-binding protein [Thermodesulfobacteriota bacterium]|nr:ATP-binding protein [Thermodesulfobacteriota bacterium]